MSLRFAITGAGYIAEIRAQALQTLPDVELVALVGRDTEKTANYFLLGGSVTGGLMGSVGSEGRG